MATGQETSNIGVMGIQSIRIGGMKIDDLPIGEAAYAKQQMPLALDADRQTKVEACIAKYPKGSIAYFRSRIEECKANISQQGTFKADMASKIANYRGLVGGSDYRDKELARLDPDGSIQKLAAERGAQRIRAQNAKPPVEPDYTGLEWDGETEAAAMQIRSLKATYPPYDEDHLQQQINQFEEAIIKADQIIAQEYISIAELTGTIARMEVRDAELKQLGVTLG